MIWLCQCVYRLGLACVTWYFPPSILWLKYQILSVRGITAWNPGCMAKVCRWYMMTALVHFGPNPVGWCRAPQAPDRCITGLWNTKTGPNRGLFLVPTFDWLGGILLRAAVWPNLLSSTPCISGYGWIAGWYLTCSRALCSIPEGLCLRGSILFGCVHSKPCA